MFRQVAGSLVSAHGELRAKPAAAPLPSGAATAEDPRPHHAGATTACASKADLERLAREFGLATLFPHLCRLAVSGLRLTPSAATAPESVEPTPLVAVIRLPTPSPLAVGGTLEIRRSLGEPETPTPTIEVKVVSPDAAGTSYVVGSGGDQRQVGVSRELVLPRAWAAPVQRLSLDAEASDRWEALRARLAEEQGVELVDSISGPVAIHRLLGYPDERTGWMPIHCELLDQGVGLGDQPVWQHPFAREVEAQASRWRLLFQASTDPDIGWRWGNRQERLYVWIAEQELRAGSFSGIRAFIQ